MAKASEPRPLDKQATLRFYKGGIDEAVKKRDVALLVDLIRTPPNSSESREYLASVIEGLLTKRISFPNRKPKQDLEDKRQAIAERVWLVKKTKGWKLRSVVDSVAKERKCSRQTVWTAWGFYGPALVATELLREKYDLDALVDGLMAAGREGKKLSDEAFNALKNFAQESEALQNSLRHNRPKAGRSK